jgi:glyoxylase-like metal-dependent hydrolase (beta-lactamase superfamily II)
MKLEIEATADSQWGTNSYLVEDVDTHDAVVIDANLEPEDMLEVVRRRGAKVRAILLTHTDGDHIAGLPRLLEELGAERELEPPLERAVMRIVGESLRNVAQHAHANAAIVRPPPNVRDTRKRSAT